MVPSGSCTGSVRHQHAMVARRYGDEPLARRAEEVAARTFELSEFLVDVLGLEDVGAYYPHRVTYHPTCHSLRLLRVGDRPLRLLRNVGGIDLVELPDAEVCCGFGGTFAVKNADTSTAMLADKMRNILATGAEVCTAGDSSCLMHIGGGLSRLNAGTRTVHLAEILACHPGSAVSTVSSACPPLRAGWAICAGPSRSRWPPAGLSPTASSAATSARPPPRSAPSGPRVVAELPDWEELREAGQAIKAHTMRAPGPLPGSSWNARSPPGAAPCTGRGTPSRPTGS